jgi:hypothetical protein
MHQFDWTILSEADRRTARLIIGGADDEVSEREPDLIIAPDGKPYLYRWAVFRDDKRSVLYFHVQTASDPERPLHDHPWDNTSVILAGGYLEQLSPNPKGKLYDVQEFERKTGDMIFRPAEYAHRLILPDGVPYTMTLFLTGPARRLWGFWTEPRETSAERHWQWVPSHILIGARKGNVSEQKGEADVTSN